MLSLSTTQLWKVISSRTDFYIARGLNTDLTDFPAPAFSESLQVAELTTEKPMLVVAYGPPVPPAADPEEEKGFARTDDAHDWLQRMESWLRRFTDERMTVAFGPDWPKHRLPNGMYDEWMEKKRAATATGEGERPLIAYADFRDYENVICKRDNWPVFAKVFERRESVRESLQRLYPVRICTMHARAITQDDELYLYVEVRRLMKAMRRT